MKEYSVKDIADLLGTNQETVRRWIRSGKLKAVDNSGKKGENKVVLDSALTAFLKTTPKYAAVASTLAGTFSLGLGAATLGIAGALNAAIAAVSAAKKVEKERTAKARISDDETIEFIARSIEEDRSKLEALIHSREELDKRIQAQTEALNTRLRQLEILEADQESTKKDKMEEET